MPPTKIAIAAMWAKPQSAYVRITTVRGSVIWPLEMSCDAIVAEAKGSFLLHIEMFSQLAIC